MTYSIKLFALIKRIAKHINSYAVCVKYLSLSVAFFVNITNDSIISSSRRNKCIFPCSQSSIFKSPDERQTSKKSPRRNSFQFSTLRFIDMSLFYQISKVVIYCLLKITFSQLRIVRFHICFAEPFVITIDFVCSR